MLGTLSRTPLRGGLLLSAVFLFSCTASQSAAPLPEKPKREIPPEEPVATPKAAPPAPLTWADATFSPRPASPSDPDLDELLSDCGTGDLALHEAAQWIADTHARRGTIPDPEELRFHLHRRGAPYVMPRLWSAKAHGLPFAKLKSHVKNWASRRSALGQFRCGAASADFDEGQVISIIQVDVQAEMQPLPTLIASSGFVDFEARIDKSSTAATVVLLPPDGPPHSITPDINHSLVSARLSLASEGTYLVQLMATQQGGPRPVAEALITVGESRPNRPAEQEVPGEDAFDATLPPADALFAMMNSARAHEGLPELERSRDLDRLAHSHSQAMEKNGRVSHDTGRLDPAQRIAAAGVEASAAGENVAFAQSVLRLHRVLWASPSHRENLLLRRWEAAGVGLAQSADDSYYATQLFIDR